MITDNTKKKKIVFAGYALSFMIPLLIAFLSFLSQGIYPGGKILVFTYDLRAQLLALYGYLSKAGPGFDNLMHSMSGGLGGNFFGTFALYISPFDFIYSFISVENLPIAVYFMIITKIGLCGLCSFVFLYYEYKDQNQLFCCVFFSSCYALMSYNFTYFVSPMWFDAVMLLPILALMLCKILKGENSIGFIIIMSICIISDYYFAYMVALALILFFIYKGGEGGLDLHTFIRRFISFAVHGLISASVSAFMLVPVYLDFDRGKFAENYDSGISRLFNNTLFEVLRSFFSQNYSGFDNASSPNIYCGTVVFILALIYLAFGAKNIKTKIAGMAIFVIYFISFIFAPIDRVWHGFRDPVCFSVRYAFTFSFFLIYFAFQGYLYLKEMLRKKNANIIGMLVGLSVFYTFFELYLNGSYILAEIGKEWGYTNSSEYQRYSDAMKTLVPYDELENPSTYGRVITNFDFSKYDGALYGYDGVAYFSSSYNYGLSKFLESLGVGTLYNRVAEDGITKPLAGLIGVKYVVSYMKDESDLYTLVSSHRGFGLYKNTDTLPLAYGVQMNHISKEDDYFDPFDGINMMCADLFGDEYSQIFERQQVNISEQTNNLEVHGSGVRSVDTMLLVPMRPGHYYLYSDFVAEKTVSDGEKDNEGYTVRNKVIRNVYLEDELIGSFGNELYSNCIGLGYLDGTEEYRLRLESTAEYIGNINIYHYNSDLYKKMISEADVFFINAIGRDGILLTGYAKEDEKILITLPYEDGYYIYVDGKNTEYYGYRDAFMYIEVENGYHEISIRYCTPGLRIGCWISLLSIMIVTSKLIHSKRKRFRT